MSSPRLLSSLLRACLMGLVVVAGCAEDKDLDDPPSCDGEIPPLEVGHESGHPAPLEAPAGQSRAGRLRASELPEDRHGLGVWAEGDFVLANDRVALVVEDAGISDLFDPYGGRPVAIARVEDARLVDAGNFNELIVGLAAYLVETETVSVLNDGTDGNAAVVRAAGPLGPVEFLGEILSALLPGSFDGLPAAIDYVMEPGSDAVDVFLEVANTDPRERVVSNVLLAFFQPNRMPRWTETSGFSSPPARLDATAFVDDEATSYAWLAPSERELSQLVEIAGATAFSVGSANLAACERTRIKLGTMVLGGPGLPGLQAALARHRGETTRTLVGSVVDAEANGGGAATDARVHVLRADGSHFARLSPDETGAFELEVPNETVTFIGYRSGTSLSDPVVVGETEDTVDLVMPEYATLTVEVTDELTGASVPARIQVFPEATVSVPPASFGEAVLASGRAHIAFKTTAPVSLRVDPGAHRVAVSRGFAYELVDEDLAEPVVAGETRELDYALRREVDLPGVMCADYHIHTHRSPDSPDSPRFKLAGMIADGLEIPIRTDHEWVRDFDPVIVDEMGLEDFAFGIGGEELTTFTWGHFNIFPLEEDPSRRNGGAIEWVGRLPPEVFAEVRARPEAPSLIINHPRMGGALGGYFAAAGFDATTGLVSRPDHWDEEFTLVEVFNDADFDDVRESVAADWFALLNSGRRVFAVGSSDSHSIRTSPVGYPRTCLDLGVDDPAALRFESDPVHLVQSTTAAGRSTISGGAYLTVEGPEGEGPGEDVDVGPAAPEFRVRVLAAAWIRGLAFVEVIVDGRTIGSHMIEDEPDELPDPSDPAVRFDQTISIPLDEISPHGSWVVFHAGSDGMQNLLDPVHPGGRRPFAVSNPIFLHP